MGSVKQEIGSVRQEIGSVKQEMGSKIDLVHQDQKEMGS